MNFSRTKYNTPILSKEISGREIVEKYLSRGDRGLSLALTVRGSCGVLRRARGKDGSGGIKAEREQESTHHPRILQQSIQ